MALHSLSFMVGSMGLSLCSGVSGLLAGMLEAMVDILTNSS